MARQVSPHSAASVWKIIGSLGPKEDLGLKVFTFSSWSWPAEQPFDQRLLPHWNLGLNSSERRAGCGWRSADWCRKLDHDSMHGRCRGRHPLRWNLCGTDGRVRY